jgi:N-acetylmuramoyl-L-alanine amidase
VLIECGFLSNPQEAANLNSPDYQKKVAFTIYKAIMSYFNTEEPQSNRGQNIENPIGLYMQ